jgi:hypothetical protein
VATQVEEDVDPGTRERPVFVDDSGRRRGRLRIVGRVLVVGLGLYVAVVAAALTGSLSLPVAHLGEVRPPREVAHGTLGEDARVMPLPRALAPPNADHAAIGVVSGTTMPSGGLVSAVPGSGGSPSAGRDRQTRDVAATEPDVVSSRTPVPVSSPTFVSRTTVPAVVTPVPAPTTTVATPPTTREHGNGPPTSHPGNGKGNGKGNSKP